MKNKLYLLFALICASMMSWAYDENVSFPDAGPYANQFSWSSIGGVTAPMGVNSVESKNGFDCIYVNVGQADFDPSTGIVGCELAGYEGAGVWIKISSLVLEDNEIYFKNSGGTTLRGLIIHNSAAGTAPFDPASIDWSSIPYITGQTQFKIYFTEVNRPNNWENINIQTAPWADNNTGIYVSFPDGVSACSLVDKTGCWIEGAQVLMYLTAFVNEVTEVTINHASGTKTLYVYNANAGGGDPDPEPSGTTFNIHEVWPAERVTASKSGDDFNVNIASYGGGQWQGQLKLEHNVSFENTKTYKVVFTLTADKNCGGITFKTDDNQGEVYENQSINLTASTPYHYEKVFKGQAGNNKITVFDFGWVGENTNITISDLTLVEFSPATASSFGGDLIPFLAVDGNAGTRWQAASKGEAWWKMDYGTSQSFNRVNITWENSYAKSFTIQGSNDDESYTTLATISGQTISTFPYKQVIDLDQLYNYRYVKFVGTENGNDYGFSFYEFEIVEVETSVLTSVVITSPKRKTVCPISSSIDITAEARDQYNMPMGGQTITYSVSPASVGTIDANGHYTASQVGEATITASCSDKQATYVVVNTISANLALNKPATAGAYETPIAEANDANLNSYWALGPNRPVDEMWWRVDLEETYDLSLVIIKWEGACPTEHAIQVSSDDANWTDVATLSGWPEIGGNDDHNYQFYSINAQGRYIRVKASALRDVGWGMKMYDFQAFGTVAASQIKSVSASVNDPAMGTATVKQGGVEVTEVATGSEVTFSAVANDGYTFVNWSNGETNATFNATVDATMNLTANFRALGTIYCNTLVHSSNGGQEHDAYVTMKRSGENEYQLIVRAEYALGNFSNTEFRIKALNAEELSNYNLNNKGVLSADNHTLTGTIISTIEPEMISGKMYVNIVGQWEGQFDRLTNIEYSQPCADPEITAIDLNKTAATLDMGNTLTLVPTFTPAYMSADVTWQTSDASVATVDNGVVTPVAAGDVTITAKVTDDIKATCAVTVQNAASHNWYGYGTSQDLDYTYRIEYTTDHHIVAHVKRQGDKTGLVGAAMNINNVWTEINVTEGEEEGWKKGTTEATFTAGNNIHILIQSAYAGPTSIIEFDYEVGSDNVMPTIVPSTLALSNTSITMGLTDADVQLIAEIHHRDAANKTISWTSDDASVVTVVDGLVHPVGVGTTTVHAATFNGISATCEVTVVGALEPTIFWGSGEDAGISILYSITRNADHTLTYAVEALHNKDGFGLRVNDGDWHDATLNEGVYTWSSTATYTDGNAFNGYFYMPFAGGAGRVDFHYVVGSESEKGNMPIRLYEDQDNSFMITASDGLIRDVKVTRSFTAGDLYTLVLPFDVDAAQTASQLPGQLTKLNNSYLKENGDLRINFVDASAVEAGVPYLYQPSANVTNPAFVGVSVSKDLNPTEPADNYAKYYGIYAPMDGEALHNKENAYVLGPDQYLYAVSDLPATQTMAALRAYFVLNFPSAPAGAPKQLAKVVFNSTETETTTNMENVQTDHTYTKVIVNGQLLIIRDGKMYNVQGQLVK